MRLLYIGTMLFVLVLISGCVGIPDVFGRDVISVQQNTVQNGVRDIIVIKDIITIPKSPLLPDQQLLFSFIAENKDNLKNTNAVVDLFNAPTIRSKDGTTSCNLYISGSTDTQTAPNRYCYPTSCGVNFEGTLTYLMPAISTDEIIKRQRSGDKTTLFTSKSYGSGPVQIDVEIQGAPYMLSSSDVQTDTVLLFTIKNVGSGNIVNSEIEGGDFNITFPPEFVVVKNRNFQGTPVENEKFNCYPSNEGGTICKTKDDVSKDDKPGAIALYKDQSRSSLMFTVHLKDAIKEPFKTFQITSGVRYDYELRDSVAMTINPFQNV